MRLLTILGCAVAVVLEITCTSDAPPTTGSAGPTSSSSGAGGGGTCDNTGGCGDGSSGCIACAESVACLFQLNECNMSSTCTTYSQCLEGCTQGDDSCLTTCADESPDGSGLYNDSLQCVVCQQCSSACSGPTNGCQ